MFSVSSDKIDTENLNQQLDNPRGGGVAIFEGRVRNHNEGRAVKALEYEVYHELALSEGQLIIKEAQEKFEILDVVVCHREGFLNIGDVAVWVGVIAKHRDAAFKACRYVIDEVKVRLPIWKREHYIGSEPEWVNCQGCQQGAHFHREHG